MKKTDRLVNLLISDIENKTVLEVACGTADFSLSAARFAKNVTCIDLDDSRLNSQIEQANIRFHTNIYLKGDTERRGFFVSGKEGAAGNTHWYFQGG